MIMKAAKLGWAGAGAGKSRAGPTAGSGRAEAGQEHGRSRNRTGARGGMGQVLGRSRVGAGRQEPVVFRQISAPMPNFIRIK